MAWLALLAALMLEQAVPTPTANPVYGLAQWLSDAAARQFNAGRARHGLYAWLALVGSAAILSAALFYAARSMHWFAAWAVDVAVLYFVFGFRQFSHPLTQMQAALEAGDVAEARRLLGDLKRRSDPAFKVTDLAPGEIARQAIDLGLVAAHRHVFGVLFWFVLLPGPVGPVMYRLSDYVARRWNPRVAAGATSLPPDRFGEFAQRAFRWIDWIPARLTALGFAIVGDFEGAVDCWRRVGAAARSNEREPLDSRTLILAAAGGALGFRILAEPEAIRLADAGRDGVELGEPDPQGMRSAVGLVWRSLVLWMILLLMLTAASILP
jgi:adenosylcobinamide-phosphate synthase